jgi:UDP-N-acetylmuramate dehydrogenase
VIIEKPLTMTTSSELRNLFGQRLHENAKLAAYTSARIGGPADYLIEVRSADELADAVEKLWSLNLPFLMLGGGSNVLISDKGIRGVVILNRAKQVTFNAGESPTVIAESGVVISNLAHRIATQGFSGMEWAATVPGTIGGAVYGNAGAFGGDMAGNLIRAEVVEYGSGRVQYPLEKMQYGYRSSILKNGDKKVVVLSAEMRLENSTRENVQKQIDEFTAQRKNTQPPGASMGSMFKNPQGDFAGRLIEAAGLKGAHIGSAEISMTHANFFLNTGNTKASDIKALIELAQKTVKEKFGIELELEVELLGEW